MLKIQEELNILNEDELNEVSAGRAGKRKPSEKKTTDAIEICPQCGEKKLKHRVCTNCGYYKYR